VIELKTPGEVDAVAAAGRVVAGILTTLREKAAPGVSPHDLDLIARDMIADAGARSSFVGYHPSWSPTPYPAVICSSVNDAVVHGIPDRRPLEPGDLLSVDFAVHLDGWCADAAFSVVVGDAPDPGDLALVDATERALAAGIAAARPGARLGDIGHAVATVARRARLGMLADHGGHGVGRSMHEAPFVPNRGKRGKGMVLQPGLVIAIEPMLQRGGRDDYVHDPDGWTLRTRDGSRAAHAEHTIAVTADGPRILTAL
jgi:methionyl aminopeptidase